MAYYGRNNSFEYDNEGFVQVWTDGSCLNNGQYGAQAGWGVSFGDHHHLNIAGAVRGRATNNAGEIQAAIEAIKQAKRHGIDRLCINTDSQFLINAMTKWIHDWIRNGWTLYNGNPVKNQADFQRLDDLCNDHDIAVKWQHVRAHQGNRRNEDADRLAKGGASGYPRNGYY